MVVTPGVAKARSSPLSFTTMPMISGGLAPAGREALYFAITSSLSAICFTCFGETKLTASMCLNPASTSSFKYSALYSVGIRSGNPCHASRGHSISFICSVIFLATPEDVIDEHKNQGHKHDKDKCQAHAAEIGRRRVGTSYPHIGSAL